MKKVYTTPEYKAKHQGRIEKYQQKSRPTYKRRLWNKGGGIVDFSPDQIPVFAPRDLRLIESTNDCLAFFREIRKEVNINLSLNGIRYVRMSLNKSPVLRLPGVWPQPTETLELFIITKPGIFPVSR